MRAGPEDKWDPSRYKALWSLHKLRLTLLPLNTWMGYCTESEKSKDHFIGSQSLRFKIWIIIFVLYISFISVTSPSRQMQVVGKIFENKERFTSLKIFYISSKVNYLRDTKKKKKIELATESCPISSRHSPVS